MDRDLLELADDSLFNEITCHPLKHTHAFAISGSCVTHSAGYTDDLLLVDQTTDATLIADLDSPPLCQTLAESNDIRKQFGLVVAAARINRIAPCDPFSGNKMHLGVDILALLPPKGVSFHRSPQSEAKLKQKKGG